MGEILDMARHKMRKMDCQGEGSFGPEFKADMDNHVRRVSAAAALSRCIRWMHADFGDTFAMECLTNEVLRVKGRK